MNARNYQDIIDLKNEYLINKYNQIYFILENEESINKLEHFKFIFELNFSYILNKEEKHNEIITTIINKKEKNKDFIDYLNSRGLYKLIIDNYTNLFDKSMYDKTTYYPKDKQ